MKKFTFLFLFSLIFSTISFGQKLGRTESNAASFRPDLRIAFGINAIQNLGSRKPFSNINEWALNGFPISGALEYKFAPKWSLEQAFNINKFDSDSEIDGDNLTKAHNYLGANTNLKWYPNWFKSDKFKLFANGGVGVFKIDEINTSANLGGGMLYWFSDTFGIRGSALAKFALNHKERVYDNNHFQYMLEVIFKL